ncbi:caspase family protein [Candidatus Marithrix sp. Canyon 246]|uniref:caspase family protein n=1 Tax=Candidatus Marithrix sp. Canyon 246 TaxID=1827136 RepID=UPI001C0E5F61|nr:caspase family protein [Candidatus Marithrix sp. Canyon 246]
MLNKQATRKNIINAWRKMVKQAQPGDTLILTYSGHGSQINDIYPFDEKLDFYEGYIIDDELTF